MIAGSGAVWVQSGDEDRPRMPPLTMPSTLMQSRQGTGGCCTGTWDVTVL